MEYEITRDGDRLFVKVAGRLDAQSAPMLEDGMSEVLKGVTEITVDLGDLEFISSAGLRILLAAYKLMAKREGVFKIEDASEDVMDVLEMSGFASLFEIA
ncbi:MAG: STAS domain-containing protein [Eggerthellaceae bacterium]|jgi:anti-anti-sigma factor|nr:STAS domain-containing protein [Eggerthellaceae bacterium]